MKSFNRRETCEQWPEPSYLLFKGSHCPLAPPSLYRVTTTTHPQSGAALFSSFSSCHSSSYLWSLSRRSPPSPKEKTLTQHAFFSVALFTFQLIWGAKLSWILSFRGISAGWVFYFELRLLSSPLVGDHGRTGCSDPTKPSGPTASNLDSFRDDVPAVDNFITISIPGPPIGTRTEPVQIRAPRNQQPGHPDPNRGSPPEQTRVLDPVACWKHTAKQRVQDGRVARCQSRLFHRGRLRAHLPSSGFRPVPEAPGRRTAYGLHQAEAARDHAGGVQCGAGPHPQRARRHPAWREPL